MTKRGQNRLVQITLHVHTHTIGGYGIGVNRLGAGWMVGRAGSVGRILAGNIGQGVGYPQTFAGLESFGDW